MAKMDKAEVAKQLFSLILGMGMGGAARGGISLPSMANASRAIISGDNTGISRFLAKNYPTEFAPGKDVVFTVHHFDSKTPNLNAEGNANYDIIDEAGHMQTLDEHNAALSKYINLLSPQDRNDPKKFRAALVLGQEEEKRLPAFWSESEPRRKFSVSSTAVNGIRLTPDARIEVRWANSKNPNKWYTFKQYANTHAASLAAQSLLQAPSIGRAVMPFQRNGKRLEFKNKKVDYSGWNELNYDPAFK